MWYMFEGRRTISDRQKEKAQRRKKSPKWKNVMYALRLARTRLFLASTIIANLDKLFNISMHNTTNTKCEVCNICNYNVITMIALYNVLLASAPLNSP